MFRSSMDFLPVTSKSVSPIGMQTARAHPRLVSCQLCRTKKLKCNRAQPCSNCIARGITCTFLVPPQRGREAVSSTSSNEQLLRRVEQLESIVGQLGSVAAGEDNTNDGSSGEQHSPSSEGAAILRLHQKQVDDIHLLDSVGTRDDSLVRLCLSAILSMQSTQRSNS